MKTEGAVVYPGVPGTYPIYLMDRIRRPWQSFLRFRLFFSIEEATRSASEMKREGWDGSLSSSNLFF